MAFTEDGGFVEGMVYVPTTRFDMGCEEPPCAPEEGPVHSEGVNGFHIDTTEVTVEAFQDFCGTLMTCVAMSTAGAFARTSQDAACNIGVALLREPRARYPANCVAWNTARDFCTKAGKRLPTEAEWELAARFDDDRTFPWGDDPPTCAHAVFQCPGQADEATSPVGDRALGQSQLGVFDLAGNTGEWTVDAHTTDHEGPVDGNKRTARGGFFGSPQTDLRTTARRGFAPETTLPAIGFRCVRSATP